MDLFTNETFWALAGGFILLTFGAHQIDSGSKERLKKIERYIDDNETHQLALEKAQNLELIRAKLEFISLLLGAILVVLTYMLVD